MAHQPVVPTQTPIQSAHDTKDWESILRDAGLPPEPPPMRNTSPLPSDPSEDFSHERSAFERYSIDIFEASQQWKQVGAITLVCEFCGHKFLGRTGQKHCSTECRRRKSANEPKEMCVGCTKTIAACEPEIVEGKKYCGWCAWCAKHRPEKKVS